MSGGGIPLRPLLVAMWILFSLLSPSTPVPIATVSPNTVPVSLQSLSSHSLHADPHSTRVLTDTDTNDHVHQEVLYPLQSQTEVYTEEDSVQSQVPFAGDSGFVGDTEEEEEGGYLNNKNKDYLVGNESPAEIARATLQREVFNSFLKKGMWFLKRLLFGPTETDRSSSSDPSSGGSLTGVIPTSLITPSQVFLYGDNVHSGLYHTSALVAQAYHALFGGVDALLGKDTQLIDGLQRFCTTQEARFDKDVNGKINDNDDVHMHNDHFQGPPSPQKSRPFFNYPPNGLNYYQTLNELDGHFLKLFQALKYHIPAFNMPPPPDQQRREKEAEAKRRAKAAAVEAATTATSGAADVNNNRAFSATSTYSSEDSVRGIVGSDGVGGVGWDFRQDNYSPYIPAYTSRTVEVKQMDESRVKSIELQKQLRRLAILQRRGRRRRRGSDVNDEKGGEHEMDRRRWWPTVPEVFDAAEREEQMFPSERVDIREHLTEREQQEDKHAITRFAGRDAKEIFANLAEDADATPTSDTGTKATDNANENTANNSGDSTLNPQKDLKTTEAAIEAVHSPDSPFREETPSERGVPSRVKVMHDNPFRDNSNPIQDSAEQIKSDDDEGETWTIGRRKYKVPKLTPSKPLLSTIPTIASYLPSFKGDKYISILTEREKSLLGKLPTKLGFSVDMLGNPDGDESENPSQREEDRLPFWRKETEFDRWVAEKQLQKSNPDTKLDLIGPAQQRELGLLGDMLSQLYAFSKRQGGSPRPSTASRMTGAFDALDAVESRHLKAAKGIGEEEEDDEDISLDDDMDGPRSWKSIQHLAFDIHLMRRFRMELDTIASSMDQAYFLMSVFREQNWRNLCNRQLLYKDYEQTFYPNSNNWYRQTDESKAPADFPLPIQPSHRSGETVEMVKGRPVWVDKNDLGISNTLRDQLTKTLYLQGKLESEKDRAESLNNISATSLSENQQTRRRRRRRSNEKVEMDLERARDDEEGQEASRSQRLRRQRRSTVVVGATPIGQDPKADNVFDEARSESGVENEFVPMSTSGIRYLGDGSAPSKSSLEQLLVEQYEQMKDGNRDKYNPEMVLSMAERLLYQALPCRRQQKRKFEAPETVLSSASVSIDHVDDIRDTVQKFGQCVMAYRDHVGNRVDRLEQVLKEGYADSAPEQQMLNAVY